MNQNFDSPVSEQGGVNPHDGSTSLQRFKLWIERRIAGRRSADEHVLVLQGTRVQSGRLVDVSDGGFGLSKVAGIVVDELISAATSDGTVLEGRVVWAKDDRAGVALLSQV